MRTFQYIVVLLGVAGLAVPASAQQPAPPEPPRATQLPLAPPPAPAVDSAPQAKLMARRAAIADAQRQLSEMIYGTELDSYTLVRDFVTERDEIRMHLRALLRGAEVTDTRYLLDGTVEVDMEVPVHRVAHIIGRRFAYPGDAFRATGTGVPNPVREEGRQPIAPPDEAPYNFTLLTINATGSGVVPPNKVGSAQGYAMAKRAAQLDAYRQLGENVMGVRVSSDTYVRDFVTESDEIRTQFDGFLRGAQITEVRQLPDGIVEVDMQVALTPLGEMIPVPNAKPPVTKRVSPPASGATSATGSGAIAPSSPSTNDGFREEASDSY